MLCQFYADRVNRREEAGNVAIPDHAAIAGKRSSWQPAGCNQTRLIHQTVPWLAHESALILRASKAAFSAPADSRLRSA